RAVASPLVPGGRFGRSREPGRGAGPHRRGAAPSRGGGGNRSAGRGGGAGAPRRRSVPAGRTRGTRLSARVGPAGAPGELAPARAAVPRAPDGPEAPEETSVFLSVHHGLHSQLRTYLLGLLSARLGEEARGAQYASEPEPLPVPSDVGSLPRALARGIRAESASRRGRPAEVTAAFEGVRRESWYELGTASAFFAQARERFVQAEALEAQGRDAEAALLYRSLGGQGSLFELPYVAPSQLRLGEIAERQGRGDEAAQHYS